MVKITPILDRRHYDTMPLLETDTTAEWCENHSIVPHILLKTSKKKQEFDPHMK